MKKLLLVTLLLWTGLEIAGVAILNTPDIILGSVIILLALGVVIFSIRKIISFVSRQQSKQLPPH